MEEDRTNILCTKIDPNAGNWPSSAFVELFRVAKKCVEPKLVSRPEIAEASDASTCYSPNLWEGQPLLKFLQSIPLQ